MRLTHLTLSAVAILSATAQAQNARLEAELRPMAPRSGPSAAPAASQLPPAPVNGSDMCATADALGSVTGTIAYDNTIATIEPTIGQTSFTGGYCNYGCAEYGSGQVAVKTAVWFSWTSPATGKLRITTCPNQNDTKVAIYPGPACPTGTSCIGCSDDYHFSGGVTAGLLDSMIFYNVTIGEQLLFQVGQSSFNTTAGFAGTFNIDIDPLHANILDDNLAEANASFFAVGAGHMGINRYADTGDVTTVSGVQVCWGWGGGTAHTNGNATVVALWSDPNGDGNPSDAALVEQVSTVISAANTDTYVLVPFTANHVMNGPYFIGTGYVRQTVGANFPLCIDNTSCEIRPDVAWLVGNTGLPVDVTNLPANTTPPIQMDGNVCQAQGAATYSGLYHGAFAIRPEIVLGPPQIGTPECFGDTAALCPCSGGGGSGIPNPGVTGNGCGNSSFPAGAKLTATGNAVDNPADTVILTCSNMPGPGLFFQANGLVGPLLNFNDGTLCAAAGIIRMGVVFPTAGSASYPGGLTPAPIHIAGAPVLTPTPTKHYQCWYRDITVGFCNTQGHNMSNGIAIVWAP